MHNKKQRESNLELLRIVSMLLITIYHFFIHSSIPNAPEMCHLTKPCITVLHIGVICFVLISGYWGIKFSLKGFFKLFLYCSFYSFLIYVVGCLINPNYNLAISTSIKSFIPSGWWFIPVYLSMYLLIPIIDKAINDAPRKTKILFIILLGVVSFGFGNYLLSLSTGKNPLNFILIYCIGNYLRTELKLPKILTAKKLFIIYLACNLLLFLFIYYTNIYTPKISKIVYKAFFPYNSFGLIINAVLFFIIFMRLNISSKIINWFASSSLAVYLLHENKYIGQYLYDFVDLMHKGIDNQFLFYSSLVALGISVFIICTFIDKLISPVFHFVINRVLKSALFIKINDKVQQLTLTKQ